MTKKNNSENYTRNMQSFKKIAQAFKQAKEIVIVFAAIFLWVLGVWLAGKLAPIIEDIRLVADQVEAHEYRLGVLEQSCAGNNKKLNQIAEDVAFIKGQVAK